MHMNATPAPLPEGASAAPAAATDSGPAALPAPRRDWLPVVLVLVLMGTGLPLAGEASTWLTLTLAGLAMGMLIFIMATGLTLIFGLMSVLNFAHGAFIAVGAYAAVSVLQRLSGWTEAESLALNLAALAAALGAAVLVTALLGWVMERVLIAPVYGQHLKQILITMGGMIVAEQAITVVWGADPVPVSIPAALRGTLLLGDAMVEVFRLVAVCAGAVVGIGLHLLLNRTRLGLLIRAGVENGPMVEALGYRIGRLFIAVFAAGAALAGLGGALWGMYRGTLQAALGTDVMVLVFIVIIIGGLGSVGGCFLASLLVALAANYAGFVAPKVALVSHIVLMIAVLLWRPAGLYGARH
jgi:branched-chain amino acid transport system permease protein